MTNKTDAMNGLMGLLDLILSPQRPSWDLDDGELNDTQMEPTDLDQLDAEIDAFQARVLGKMDNADAFINDAIGLFINRYCSQFTIVEIEGDQENFLRGLNAALYASFVGVEVPKVIIEDITVKFASVDPVGCKSVRR